MRIGIVGAGLSGLATAFYLQRALPAVEMVIYEAGAEAGGALHTENVQGFLFEAGGLTPKLSRGAEPSQANSAMSAGVPC